MNILESIVYGIISGISEFLPVSSFGHQGLMKTIFGVTGPEPLRDIFVHIAMLIAVLISSGTYLERLRRERSTGTQRRKSVRQTDRRTAQELRLIRTACVPIIIGLLFSLLTLKLRTNLIFIVLFFVINGILLYIPEHMLHANKSAGQLSFLDAILIGLFGALSVFPGISRVGSSLSCAIARGADQEKAYNWILIISIPSIFVLLFVDIISIFFTGFGVITFVSFFGYLISAIFAFASAMAGIYLMRLITRRSGITYFAFYCWGVAFLSFLLYLFA